MAKDTIFEPNTTEHRIWHMHHDGLAIDQIAEKVKSTYDYVKDVILYGWRKMD